MQCVPAARADGIGDMTQTAQILALLRANGERGLTAIEALREANCFRLAARIADLKAEGYEITSTMETTDTGKRIARYRIVERPSWSAGDQLSWTA